MMAGGSTTRSANCIPRIPVLLIRRRPLIPSAVDLYWSSGMDGLVLQMQNVPLSFCTHKIYYISHLLEQKKVSSRGYLGKKIVFNLFRRNVQVSINITYSIFKPTYTRRSGGTNLTFHLGHHQHRVGDTELSPVSFIILLIERFISILCRLFSGSSMRWAFLMMVLWCCIMATAVVFTCPPI